MAAVRKTQGGVEQHRLTREHEVQHKGQVVCDLQVVIEVDRLNFVGAKRQGRPVHPIAIEQTRGQVLALHHAPLSRTGHNHVFFHDISQGHGGAPFLIDHVGVGLNHRGFGVGRVGFEHGGHVIGQEHIVTAHEHHQLARGHGSALAVVVHHTRVAFVAHVGDARVVELGHPLADRWIGVSIVNDGQSPIGAVLGQHTVHGFLHERWIAPVRDHDI